MDVHARRQPQRHAERLHFLGNGVPELTHQRKIKGLGKHGADGNGCAELVMLLSAFVKVHGLEQTVFQCLIRAHGKQRTGGRVGFVTLLEPEPCRSVRQDHGRKHTALNTRACLACCTGYAGGRAAHNVFFLTSRLTADKACLVLGGKQGKRSLDGIGQGRTVGCAGLRHITAEGIQR